MPGPALSRRRLRTALRTMRQDRGLGLAEVRQAMDWSASKLIRIESGEVGISVSDLRFLLSHYGVTDVAAVNRLTQLARETRKRHWSGAFRDVLTPSATRVLGYEGDAVRIVQVNHLVVPELLRTEAYARALLEIDPHRRSAIDVDRRVRLHSARQVRVFAPDCVVAMTAVVDESALRRNVGGPEALAEQIDYLIAATEVQGVQLVVIPTSNAWSTPMASFGIIEFEQDPPVAYCGDMHGGVELFENPCDVASYQSMLASLLGAGLDPEATRATLDEMRARAGSGGVRAGDSHRRVEPVR